MSNVAEPAPEAAPAPAPVIHKDASRCRTPRCVKYHDFFQWNGKYYCLECYDALVKAERGDLEGYTVRRKEEPTEA
ncbi:MAG: hypothetical protein ACYTFT_00655 [Planctomycetota bacterium]|jgi:hypothetical protein